MLTVRTDVDAPLLPLRPEAEAITEDEQSMRQCVAGDIAGLERLHLLYGGACLALARRTLRDAHHAEDAVQEAFLDLWRHADRFDSKRATPSSWLLTMTFRRAVDRVRIEQRRRTSAWSDSCEQDDPAAGPEALALRALEAQRLLLALKDLPEGQFQVLSLAYWGHLTMAEIALQLGIPLGTVKTRSRSGMITLAVALTRGDAETSIDRRRAARARNRNQG